MQREYKMLAIFSGLLMIGLWIFLGFNTAFAFLAGAIASASAGFGL